MRCLASLMLCALVCLSRPAMAAEGDATPALVALEVEIVELAGGGPAEADDKLLARVREAVAGGKAKRTTRVRLSTLAGQPATVQFGQREAMVTGRTRAPAAGERGGFGGGGGFGQTSYAYQSFGTQLSATPTVDDKGAIRVQLQLEQSCPDRPAPSADMKEPETPPGSSTLTTQTTVALRSGRPTVVAALTGHAAGEETLTVVVASGSVLK